MPAEPFSQPNIIVRGRETSVPFLAPRLFRPMSSFLPSSTVGRTQMALLCPVRLPCFCSTNPFFWAPRGDGKHPNLSSENSTVSNWPNHSCRDVGSASLVFRGRVEAGASPFLWAVSAPQAQSIRREADSLCQVSAVPFTDAPTPALFQKPLWMLLPLQKPPAF